MTFTVVTQLETVGGHDILEKKKKIKRQRRRDLSRAERLLADFPPPTSHRCAITGASAHECSALIPFFPFLKTTTEKDLSNHLRDREKMDVVRGGVEQVDR